MIYGVGTDLIEVARIARALERHGERFAERILCGSELARYRAHLKPAHFLAKRFAAKEAFAKALGTGIHAPANWHGVWVVNEQSGQPHLAFSAALAELLAKRGVRRAHVSLSDEREMASATVILEGEA